MIDNTEKEVMREFARACPKLNAAIAKRRYLLPKVRQADYVSQDFCDNHFRRMIMEWGLGRIANNNSSAIEALNLLAALKYDRPLLYLERELGEKLIETDLPEDFTTEDIHWPWPNFRVMLPLKLVGASHFKGVPMHAVYFDLTLWEKGMEMGLDRKYAVELKGFLGKHTRSVEEMSGFQLQEHSSGFYLSAMSDYQMPDFMPDVASCLASWKNWKLRDMIASSGRILNGNKQGEVNHKFLERCRLLAFNLLLFFSQEPLSVMPDQWVRKPKTEGKHLVSGLLPARFVGDCMPKFRANPPINPKDPEPSGEHYAPHWVRGYWKRVVYGKGRALRKRQWIMPYRTGKIV
jgi:hypothetical protein